MKCPMETGGNAQSLLDLAAGKLNAGKRAELELHLKACPDCREFAGGQQAVWQALDAWEPAEVSLDFDRRLYQRIELQSTWWNRFVQSFHPLFRHAVPIGAIAAVILMAGLLTNRPAGIPAPSASAPETAQVQPLQPDQVEHALDDVEMLREFSRFAKPDNADPKM